MIMISSSQSSSQGSSNSSSSNSSCTGGGDNANANTNTNTNTKDDKLQDTIPMDNKPKDTNPSDAKRQELKRTYPHFPSRLKEVFRSDNRKEMAKRIKVSKVAIGYYLTQVRMPTVEILLRISKATGCSIHWLVTGEGAKYILRSATDFNNPAPVSNLPAAKESICTSVLIKRNGTENSKNDLIVKAYPANPQP